MPARGTVKPTTTVAISDSTRAKIKLLENTMTGRLSFYYGQDGPKRATAEDAIAYAVESALFNFGIIGGPSEVDSMHQVIENAGMMLVKRIKEVN